MKGGARQVNARGAPRFPRSSSGTTRRSAYGPPQRQQLLKVSRWHPSVSAGQLPPQTPAELPHAGVGAQPQRERRITGASPGGHCVPLQSKTQGSVLVVNVVVETVVALASVLVVVVVVTVVVDAQGGWSPGAQASQQLGSPPQQASPPRGGLHAPQDSSIEHDCFPRELRRQQVTTPVLPQVDLA